jgi:hypothetical protein
MKSYSKAPDPDATVARMLAEYHPGLQGVQCVTVSCLFVFDLESSEPVLKHQGYPAAAVVRITQLRDRALGISDAIIVVDRSIWLTFSPRQQNALIDHELTHLERVVDEETGFPLYDALDRPKLTMRRHDHQLGWFDEIAQRHGDASVEVNQARQLVESTGQLYFDFGRPKATVVEMRRSAHV